MKARTIRFWLSTALAVTSALVGFGAGGSSVAESPLSPWIVIGDDATSARPSPDAVSYIQPTSYAALRLDQTVLESRLAKSVDQDVSPTGSTSIEIPDPSGSLQSFAVSEVAIFEAELAAQLPGFAAYVGTAADGSGDTIRLEVSPYGFHAQVASVNGWWYVDPYFHNDTSLYVSYYKSDLENTHDWMEASVPESLADEFIEAVTEERTQVAARSGSSLRTYRLAVSTDDQYSTFHGGSAADVAPVMAAITTVVNRLNGIYGPELGIRFTLVANNMNIIYTTDASNGGPCPATPVAGPYCDPHVPNGIGINQTVVDNVIGDANYDVGHLFSTNCGLAQSPSVGQTGSKASGCSGVGSPANDPFVVDYVSHEIGHQFGGSHTFNGARGVGSCADQRGADSAYEVGSGTTIQAYAGICGLDDVQFQNATGATGSSDPYFHSRSFDQIIEYSTTAGSPGNLGATPSGNTTPTAIAGPDAAIPTSTPFLLAGRGIDGDAGDTLTHQWDQRDLGEQRKLEEPQITAGPLFRSQPPTASGIRYLPRLSEVVANNTNVPGPCPPLTFVMGAAQRCWSEFIPTAARTMNFRLTVRDSNATAGGVNTDDVVVTVVDTGAPFRVTQPNTALVAAGGSSQVVTWDVAGTTAAPIGASTVTIKMSLDSGVTFPYVLATDTINDGSESVVMPGVAANAQARVMVVRGGTECGPQFFDVSDADFTVTTGGTVSAPPTPTGCVTAAPPPPPPPTTPTTSTTVPPTSTTAPPPPPPPSLIETLSPARFSDSRATGTTLDGVSQRYGPVPAGNEVVVQIGGRGAVPADAAGAVLNVTAIGAAGVGFITAHPCVTPRPLASSLNYTQGVNLGNEIVAGLDATGRACFFTSESIQLTVDVTGFIPKGSPATSITPRRLLDTRPTGSTVDGRFVAGPKPGAGSTTKLFVAGRGGVDILASAVIVNVTAIGGDEVGFVTVDACVTPRPNASSLNYVPGTNRGNELIATLTTDGEICLYTSASVHLTVDVVGYLPTNQSVNAVNPARLLDTRPTGLTVDGNDRGGGKGPANSSYTLLVAGRASVPPTGAKAVVINVTAIGAEGVGFITVHPCVTPLPTASSLNYVSGVNGGNEIVASLTSDGKICLFTSATTHVTVDVVAYIT